MKKATLIFTFIVIVLTSFAQRNTTTVRSYYRKDGTFVNSHSRNYNTGGNSSRSSYPSPGSYNPTDNDDIEIIESDLKPGRDNTNKFLKRVGNLRINPSTLTSDTSGVIIYLAVLRYNDTSVVDICPLARRASTSEVETGSLYFKIPKDKIKPDHIIELVSKYRFDLKDDYLLKSEYLGIGKMDLPKYLSLKLEALTLK